MCRTETDVAGRGSGSDPNPTGSAQGTREFEQGLLGYLRGEGKAILDTIRTEKQISDDTRAKLKSALDSFSKTFA